jgi:hypothetical protein
MIIQNAIKLIHSESDSWVRVEQTRKIPRGLELRFGIYRGEHGAKTDSWSVKCLGVRDSVITALDGGGLLFYPGTHPAARRFTARRAVLRWRGIRDKDAVIGALYGAHIAVMGDWLPFDDVVSIEAISRRTSSCSGPDFLMRAYAKALRAKGERVQLTLRGGSKEKSMGLKVLHFGESYVIAAAFTALRQT